MREYLIRCTSGDWFNFKGLVLADILRPNSIPSTDATGSGYGDHIISVGDSFISYSYEDPGIQACVDGDLADEMADRVIREVAANLASATGQGAKVILISP